MSLNEWSLVYFGSTVLFMFMQILSLFAKLTIGKIIFTILFWLVACAGTLVYGIATSQIGFILLFTAQILMVGIIFVFYGRTINGNQKSK